MRACRDFANGFLVAELLSCYFPADIQLHSYSNVHSLERKKNNWYLLDKFFKARGFAASTTNTWRSAYVSQSAYLCFARQHPASS